MTPPDTKSAEARGHAAAILDLSCVKGLYWSWSPAERAAWDWLKSLAPTKPPESVPDICGHCKGEFLPGHVCACGESCWYQVQKQAKPREYKISERRVGCETGDGMLIIHKASKSCEVCAPSVPGEARRRIEAFINEPDPPRVAEPAEEK